MRRRLKKSHAIINYVEIRMRAFTIKPVYNNQLVDLNNELINFNDLATSADVAEIGNANTLKCC